MEFEWDPTKAEANLRKHGVSFLKATEVFRDAFRQDQPDVSYDNPEDRWITLGRVEHLCFACRVHTTWRKHPSHLRPKGHAQ